MLKKQSPKTLAVWLGLAAIIALIDQYSKLLILRNFALHDTVVVNGFFNLTRRHNPGAAFSFLADAGGWQRWFFLTISVLAVVVIVYFLLRHGSQKLFAGSLSLILGGAIGNLIDRSLHGYVVDFLEFHFQFLSPMFYQGYFPAFNVADMAISLGAVCLILDELRRVKKS